MEEDLEDGGMLQPQIQGYIIPCRGKILLKQFKEGFQGNDSLSLQILLDKLVRKMITN